MDRGGIEWYYSCMTLRNPIPVFNLFGETDAFPDVIHCERIWDRARLHDWRISAHRHRDMVQVFHIEKGRAEAQVDGKALKYQDGEFLYVPTMVVHGFFYPQGAEGTVLSFPLTLLRGLAVTSNDLPARLGRVIQGRSSERLNALVPMISEVFASTGTFRASLLVSLAQAILSDVAEAAVLADQESQPQALRHMTEFDRLLRSHINRGWGVAEFAQELSITTGHLNRLCQAATGQSASQHIEAARMVEASRLLAYTQLSVAEIGFRLGYDDPPYFSRRFRMATGQTPSTYRAQFGV